MERRSSVMTQTKIAAAHTGQAVRSMARRKRLKARQASKILGKSKSWGRIGLLLSVRLKVGLNHNPGVSSS